MIGVIRLRGKINTSKGVNGTMNILGLKRVNTLAVFPESETFNGMIKKIESFVAWGEVSEDVLKLLKEKGDKNVFRLNPPKKGLKSIRKAYPRGDLGYRGDKINDLIKRML